MLSAAFACKITSASSDVTPPSSLGYQRGSGGCDYLLTNDFRALGEIEKQIGDAVVPSPIILKALVMGGTIGKSCALAKLGEISRKRDWLGRPIYRYAMRYFDCGLSDTEGWSLVRLSR